MPSFLFKILIKNLAASVTFIIFFIGPSVAISEIYTCTEKTGVMHILDKKDLLAKKYECVPRLLTETGTERSKNFIDQINLHESFNRIKKSKSASESNNGKIPGQKEYEIGTEYLLGFRVPKDTKKAEKWYRKAAELGNARAQAEFGWWYHESTNVPHDYKEAEKWYRKAAEQGNAAGQTGLGALYLAGKGVPRDHMEAEKWYRKAAEQGSAIAQFVLGLLYHENLAVPQDLIQAHMWANLAASHGVKGHFAELRDKIEKQMTPEQIAKAQELARNWKPVKPSEAGPNSNKNLPGQ
ncbi:MAG: sel1 repeat family protein [Magnetococcus sp. YQC-5]